MKSPKSLNSVKLYEQVISLYTLYNQNNEIIYIQFL